jgi:hypothetical protein
MNELLYVAVQAISFGYRLYHPRSPCNVNAPHAIAVQYAGAQRIENESEVHHPNCSCLAQNLRHAPTRRLHSQIDSFELKWNSAVEGRMGVQSNNVEAPEQRQQALAKTSSDSRDQQ